MQPRHGWESHGPIPQTRQLQEEAGGQKDALLGRRPCPRGCRVGRRCQGKDCAKSERELMDEGQRGTDTWDNVGQRAEPPLSIFLSLVIRLYEGQTRDKQEHLGSLRTSAPPGVLFGGGTCVWRDNNSTGKRTNHFGTFPNPIYNPRSTHARRRTDSTTTPTCTEHPGRPVPHAKSCRAGRWLIDFLGARADNYSITRSRLEAEQRELVTPAAPDRGHFVSTHDARRGYCNPNNQDSSGVVPRAFVRLHLEAA